MFILYAVMLVGVCAVLLGLMLDAVVSVSRKPQWGHPRRTLALVEVEDRRVQQLPYVGQERRLSQLAQEPVEERKRA